MTHLHFYIRAQKRRGACRRMESRGIKLNNVMHSHRFVYSVFFHMAPHQRHYQSHMLTRKRTGKSCPSLGRCHALSSNANAGNRRNFSVGPAHRTRNLNKNHRTSTNTYNYLYLYLSLFFSVSLAVSLFLGISRGFPKFNVRV